MRSWLSHAFEKKHRKYELGIFADLEAYLVAIFCLHLCSMKFQDQAIHDIDPIKSGLVGKSKTVARLRLGVVE